MLVAEGSHGDVVNIAIDDMTPYRLWVSLAGESTASLAGEVQFAAFRRNGARTTARRHGDRSGRRQGETPDNDEELAMEGTGAGGLAWREAAS